MKFNRLILTFIAVAMLAVYCLPRAHASLLPLASFSQTTGGAQPFVYTDPAALPGFTDATFDINPAVDSVVWTPLNSVFGLPVGVPVPARIVMTGNALTPPAGAPLTTQDIEIVPKGVNPHGMLIIGTAGALAGKLLLGMDAVSYFGPGIPNGGIYGGQLGLNSTSMIGTDDSNVISPAHITYFSDLASFADLNGTTGAGAVRSYSFDMTGLNVPLAIAADLADFTSHRGQISGNFSFSRVPEPSALAMFVGLGVTGSLFGFRLRRRR